MTEFELDGKQYRIQKLNALQQFNLQRKIAPLIPPLIPAFVEIGKQKKGIESITPEAVVAMAPLLQPFADAIAGLPDAAAEYVLSTSLSALQRNQGGNWAPIWSARHSTVMFSDIDDMSTLLPLVVRVILDSLGPFIRGLLTSQEETSDAASSPTSNGISSRAVKTGS